MVAGDADDTQEGLPSPADVDARALRVARRVYVENVGVWRAPRVVASASLLILAWGALPSLPGAQTFLGARPAVALAVMAGQVAILAVGAWRLRGGPPQDRVAAALPWLDPLWWCLGHGLVVGTAATAWSPYWLGLAAFVALMSQNVHRHRDYAAALLGAGALAVGGPLARGDLEDALLAFLLSAGLLGLQAMAWRTGWDRVRQQARVELLQERLAEERAAQERSRIARDLHDGVGSDLMALLWQVQLLEGEEAPGLTDAVRTAADNLRAVVREASGRPATATEVARELDRSLLLRAAPAETSVRITGDVHRPLDAGLAAVLPLVVREAVANACRHGGATTVRTTLHVDDDRVSVEVVDDGRGPAEAPAEGHGLPSLRARAAAFDGDCALHARPEGGARLLWTARQGPAPSPAAAR